MTVLASAPPLAAVDAAQAGVSQLRSVPGTVGRAAMLDGGGLSLAAPHQVFHLALFDVGGLRISDHARPVGWRFMVVDESRAVGAVEVREEDEDAAGYVFSHFNSGPFVDSTVKAFSRLEELGREAHDLRLLDVPALYVQALWLHGSADEYMPLRPAPGPLEPYRIYSAEEFARQLAALATTPSDGPALAP
ncbi:hypothetical protein SAMN05216486_1195 [bacterium JGI 053]|nr:hypothetical protein SAMN05216486_1195 [bacterium JGI 053]